MRPAAIALVLMVVTACHGSTELVPLLASAGVPLTQPTMVPLRVVTRSTAVDDPLPMRGSSVVYGDIEAALGHAVASATVPWADAHRSHPSSKDGWQLNVEITNDDAAYDDHRVIFSVAVRATLRARAGNVYLAQTQASCRQGGIAEANRGAPIMYRCMLEIGRDLAGWLDGVDLDAAKPRGSTQFGPLSPSHVSPTQLGPEVSPCLNVRYSVFHCSPSERSRWEPDAPALSCSRGTARSFSIQSTAGFSTRCSSRAGIAPRVRSGCRTESVLGLTTST